MTTEVQPQPQPQRSVQTQPIEHSAVSPLLPRMANIAAGRRQQRQQRRMGPNLHHTTSTVPSAFLPPPSSIMPPITFNATSPTPLRRYIPALASCASTPIWAKLCIPILAVFCHTMFYYGQTEPMWKLHANATIDVWANATSYTARRFFQGTGVPYENEFHIAQEEDVQTFTYYFAIHELWTAKDLPGLVIPRLAAILLIVFSGIWPHLKLIMLNLTWFFGRHPVRRTRTLQWLSGLGKWSLADVLVVCVMVGVLHLDWIVEPDAIKQGLMTDLPSLMEIVETLYTPQELCDKLLKMNCSSQRRIDMKAKCKTCSVTIGEAYAHPGWAGSMGKTILEGVDTSGGGSATLRVVGMRGIYAFCGAVILSILLSLIVDIFDVRAKRVAQQSEEELVVERLGLQDGERAVRRLIPETAAAPRRTRRNTASSDEGLEEPLLISDASAISATNSLEIEVGGDDGISSILSQPIASLFSFQFLVFSGVTAFVVFLAVDLFTMERLVYGAGPKLLSDILGVNFEKLYSMRSLMWTTGAAGGWDTMLMGTFGLFCVFGPFVRGVLLAFMVLLDQFKIPLSGLATAVSFLGSFCSWEVFAIAIVMVQMLMPTITNTIVQNPLCGQISDDGTCFMVEFNIIPYTFCALVLGGFLLVGLSWTATSRAMKHDETTETNASRRNVRPGRSIMSRVMTPNHDYQRLLSQVQEGQFDNTQEDGLEELVFETNQV
ncbi:paraquat-inducible protein A domain containing protein [Nitzschia inconspicua]|uniref:Paraquat-inducible protein A domain containing protein n=1 Tax=Nitzschia inconspicua TaxID=303405 RepID=A0A9K3LHU1_9STRA|nr:paraquat-inducible protein A domain containing protein [Nitzschia inconspicua]KAG7362689.1 paraquat-inducible protein A domain containing protein [Nitzschia inconspicua]